MVSKKAEIAKATSKIEYMQAFLADTATNRDSTKASRKKLETEIEDLRRQLDDKEALKQWVVTHNLFGSPLSPLEIYSTALWWCLWITRDLSDTLLQDRKELVSVQKTITKLRDSVQVCACGLLECGDRAPFH